MHGCWIKFTNSENLNNSFSISVYYIGKILMYFNTSTNIFLYICLGKSLRKDFVAISAFKYCKRIYNRDGNGKITTKRRRSGILNQNALLIEDKHNK